MPVTVVVGGQYGSEGKGKICAHLALTGEADFMVRCGGPNSGHTVDKDGIVYELMQVPAGFVNPDVRLLIAAGAIVNPDTLLHEIELCGLDESRIGIDRNTVIIEEADIQTESTGELRARLGTTAQGVGAAVARRVARVPGVRLAKDVPELRRYVTSVSEELQTANQSNRQIVIEGTQGFGLSLYHTEEWPYCTSRDTTAHSFLSEVGLGVRDYSVVMCLRTFPIRVAGNSGPLPEEITWEELQAKSRYPHSIKELTTTTKRLRRVALFNREVVRRAVAANCPSAVSLHGVDYLDFANRGLDSFDGLTTSTREWVSELEAEIGVPVDFVGTGPSISELIDRRHRLLGRGNFPASKVSALA
ncbi:MAG: adenylosuccinate synthetase [Chloroflexi bacterium]|nr:adenylosuccinate synthetase [Chloroflexota bacterium]